MAGKKVTLVVSEKEYIELKKILLDRKVTFSAWVRKQMEQYLNQDKTK